MAGLDSITPTDETPVDTAVTPSAPSGLAGYTSIAGPKGTKTLLDPTNSEAILKRMQDQLDARTGPMASFQSNMKDAIAAWAPYTQVNAAMSQRDQDKRAEQTDTDAMQMQIANFRAQQALQAASRQNFGDVLAKYNQGVQGAQTPQSDQGTQGTQGTQLPIDPAVMANIMSLAQTNPEAAQAEYTKALAARSLQAGKTKGDLTLAQYNYEHNPAMMEQRQWAIPGQPGKYFFGSIVDFQKAYPNNQPAPTAGAPTAGAETPPSFDVHKSYGTPAKLLDNLSDAESSQDPYAINPVSKALGRYQFTPETAAMLHKQGVKFNPFDADESRAAADYYIQQLVKQNGGDYTKAMMQYGGFKKADPTKYLSQVMNGVDLGNAPTAAPTAVAPTAAPTAAAPTAATMSKTQAPITPVQAIVQPTGQAPVAVQHIPHAWGESTEASKTIDQKNADLDAAALGATQKVGQAKATSTATALGTDSAKRESALRAQKDSTLATMRDADLVSNLAINSPHLFAPTQQGDITSITRSIFGDKLPIVGGNPENIVQQIKYSPEEIANRKMADDASARLQIDFAKQAFAGTRMEQSFLRLAQQAKGVGTNSSASSNVLAATLMKAAAQLVQAKNEMLDQYHTKYGLDAPFEVLESSPAYKQLEIKTNNNLAKQFPSHFKPISSFDAYKKGQI